MQTSIKRYFIVLVLLNTYVVTHARQLTVINYYAEPITLTLTGLVSDGKSLITVPPRFGTNWPNITPSETHFNLQAGTGSISNSKKKKPVFIKSSDANKNIDITINPESEEMLYLIQQNK